MSSLPKRTTLDKINILTTVGYPRPHLGGSLIAHPCERYLVYSFRWAYMSKIESKLNRIFRLGDAIEDIIIKDLKRAGITHGGSQTRVSGYRGHAGGSVDGIVEEVPEYPDETLLFEAKSMNHNNFLDVKRKGVKVSKPIYYGQMQIYMGKLDLDKAMFVSLDKNTSDLYIEFVHFDEYEYEHLIDREEDIIEAKHINEFPRISNNPSWFNCKFCDAKEVCHSGITPEKNCRTCDHAELCDEGVWYCRVHKEDQSVEDQEHGCEMWNLSEVFS
jgi:hypothetical protein